MPTSLGPAEIMVVLVVALIVLGPNRLPEAGRQLGRAMREARRWSTRLQDEVRSTLNDEPEPVPPVASSTSTPGPVETPKPIDVQGPAGPGGHTQSSDQQRPELN
jgi:sec-independent protein translocase protein TatA